MAYSGELAGRVRGYFAEREDVIEKNMFGGLAFMVAGHMCVGVKDDLLMARVGPDYYDEALLKPGARLMDFTGRPMRGFVYIDEEHLAGEGLKSWVGHCESYVMSLPAK